MQCKKMVRGAMGPQARDVYGAEAKALEAVVVGWLNGSIDPVSVSGGAAASGEVLERQIDPKTGRTRMIEDEGGARRPAPPKRRRLRLEDVVSATHYGGDFVESDPSSPGTPPDEVRVALSDGSQVCLLAPEPEAEPKAPPAPPAPNDASGTPPGSTSDSND